jgi:dCTP deaminase
MFTQTNSGNPIGVQTGIFNTGSVLGGNEILTAIREKRIICHPFVESNLQTSSIDVTLGRFYYREATTDKLKAEAIVTIYDNNFRHKEYPLRVYSSTHMWDADGINGAATSIDSAFQEIEPRDGLINGANVFLIGTAVSDSAEYIALRPGENILGHTNEFIGTMKGSGLTTMCQTKSTVGRSLIETCKCAGWGDVGFFNRWTLEITNNSKNIVILQVGQPIAQIVFLKVSGCLKDDSYINKGSYQVSDNFTEVINTWTPTMMLPKPKDNTKPNLKY